MDHNDIKKLFEGLGLDSCKSSLSKEQEKKLEESMSGKITIENTPMSVKIEGYASAVSLIIMLQEFGEVVKESTGFDMVEIMAMKDTVKSLVKITDAGIQLDTAYNMILNAIEGDKKGDRK